jgi:hypothetical protein
LVFPSKILSTNACEFVFTSILTQEYEFTATLFVPKNKKTLLIRVNKVFVWEIYLV